MNRNNKKERGQAALELAIFGAIIIFVIGMMIRSATSSSYSQAESLKAMRFAMLQSLQGSRIGSTSRSMSSVIFIEDRLSPGFDKFGSMDRSMFLAQGTGTFTNLLFYPVSFDEVENNLPTTDIYINGVHVPLTTANLTHIDHYPPLIKGGDTNHPSNYKRQYLCNEPGPDRCAGKIPDPRGDGSYHYKGWNFKCVEGVNKIIANPTIIPTIQNQSRGGPNNQGNVGIGTTALPGFIVTDDGIWFGCQMYYSIVPNVSAFSGKFCTRDICSDSATDPLSADERWDLNRNENFDDDPKLDTQTKVGRAQMSWQWGATNGLYPQVNLGNGNTSQNGGFPNYDVNDDGQEETLYWTTERLPLFIPSDKINLSVRQLVYKINPELIAQINAGIKDANYLYDVYGIISGVHALDATAGDINFTQDFKTQGQVGLLNDMAIYTRPSKNGGATYMEIRNGKLFVAGKNTVVRSLNKRDTADVIERRIRLSNNTGRFCLPRYVSCDGHSEITTEALCPNDNRIYDYQNPTTPACIANKGTRGSCVIGPNPVEVCTASNTDEADRFLNHEGNDSAITNDCFQGSNVSKTCMDVTTRMMYVRSRIINRQGHKWVTDAAGLSAGGNVGIGTARVKWGELNIK